jgi:hypothetical protein
MARTSYFITLASGYVVLTDAPNLKTAIDISLKEEAEVRKELSEYQFAKACGDTLDFGTDENGEYTISNFLN